MDFVIDRLLLGNEKHLLVVGNERRFISDLPENVFIVSKENWEELSKLHLIDFDIMPHSHTKAFKELQKHGMASDVPWSVCIPQKLYSVSVNGFVDKLSSIDWTYYTTTYQRSGKILQRLVPARINEEYYAEICSESSVAQSFEPNNQFSKKVSYSRVETVTGRLKVVSGPNLLNLKKEHRKILVSRFGKNGSVVSLDYKSLEPRTLLCLGKKLVTDELWNPTNRREERDLYKSILTEVFEEGTITRDDVKKLVLSELYGAGQETIAKEVPHIKHLDEALKSVRTFFNLDSLKVSLMKEVDKHEREWLVNFYGRKIDVRDAAPYMFPNREVQSVAVDIALQGFSQIMDYVSYLGREETILPLFVLHDALFLDVHENAFHVLPTLCKIGSVDIPGFEEESFYIQQEKNL